MMKKIFLYMTILATAITSCDLDINEDPDSPGNSDVTPDLIFPAISGQIAAAVGGQIYNYAGFFAQYFEQKPELNQYNDLAEYNITESSMVMDYSYRTLFSGALQDCKEVLDKSTNPADRFATTVLRAYAFMIVVDNTSDSPYSEALQGNANPTPNWDKGDDVYKGILDELDEAEAELTASAKMDSPDLLLDGDMDQWIGFANALRLRMFLRFIDGNVDVSNYTSKAVALVQANNFFSGNIEFDAFRNETNKYNPWYNTNVVGLPGNHCAAYPLITYLTETNDPRVSYGIDVNAADGKYVGQIPGGKTFMQSILGTENWRNPQVSGINYTVGVTKPVCFFTQANLQFLIAEVYLRFLNDNLSAQTAYEAAVTADFDARNMGGQESNIIGTGGAVEWSTATTQEQRLELIYMQKWVAFFYMDHMEAWSEIRRTDYPKLSPLSAAQIQSNPAAYEAGNLIAPWRNGLEAGGLIKRIPYPLDARQYNPNTPQVALASTPVWWDIK